MTLDETKKILIELLEEKERAGPKAIFQVYAIESALQKFDELEYERDEAIGNYNILKDEYYSEAQ